MQIYPNIAGFILYNQGNYDEAIELFKKSIQLRNNNAYSWFNLYRAYRKKGQDDDAKEALKKAIEGGFRPSA